MLKPVLSEQLEIDSRLAAIAARLDVKADFLVVSEARQAGPFDSGNMNENVFCAAIRGNEAEAFGGVKPFHGASSHVKIPFVFNAVHRMRQLG